MAFELIGGRRRARRHRAAARRRRRLPARTAGRPPNSGKSVAVRIGDNTWTAAASLAKLPHCAASGSQAVALLCLTALATRGSPDDHARAAMNCFAGDAVGPSLAADTFSLMIRMPSPGLFAPGRAGAAALVLFGLAIAGCAGIAPPSRTILRLSPSDVRPRGFRDIDDRLCPRRQMSRRGLGRHEAAHHDRLRRRGAPARRHRRRSCQEPDAAPPSIAGPACRRIGATDGRQDVLDQARPANLRARSAALGRKDLAGGVRPASSASSTGFRAMSGADARENRALRNGFGGIGIAHLGRGGQVEVISVMHDTPAEAPASSRRRHREDRRQADRPDSTQQRSCTSCADRSAAASTLTIARGARIRAVRRHGHARPHGRRRPSNYRREGNIAYIRIYSFNSGHRREPGARDGRAEEGDRRRRCSGSSSTSATIPAACSTRRWTSPTCSSPRAASSRPRAAHRTASSTTMPRGGDIADGKPIVVLVNGNSASVVGDRGRGAPGQPPRGRCRQQLLRQGHGADRVHAAQ